MASILAMVVSAAACDLRGAAPRGPAVPGEGDVAEPAHGLQPSARIEVHGDPEAAASTSFELYDTDDLTFEVAWSTPPDGTPTIQTLQIYSPDGVVYREASAPAGEPLRYVLPVAGTTISRHAITGTWWAELRLEGQASAISAIEFGISSTARVGQ